MAEVCGVTCWEPLAKPQMTEATMFHGKLIRGRWKQLDTQPPGCPMCGAEAEWVVEILAEDKGGQLRGHRTHGAHGKLEGETQQERALWGMPRL